MKYSIAISENIHQKACKHLIRKDNQEDLCFALWNPGKGKRRYTGLVESLILPEEDDRHVHGNVSFTAQFLDRILLIALSKGCGIAFMHSHPSSGWQDMSEDDVFAEKIRLASKVKATTGLPLIGMTLGIDGTWSARFWIKRKPKLYHLEWCETVRIIGTKLSISFNNNLIKPPEYIEELTRTISAWGKDTQSKLARHTVGIVGLGSVGSIVAESLARIGVKHIKLIDFDLIERKNLDRVLGATSSDIGKAKVDAIKRTIQKSAVYKNSIIEKSYWSICEEPGFREAIDCDVLFCCVDRPWPRFVLNFIAFAYMIPVVDGGIRVKTNNTNTKITGADWKVQTISPGRPCMECLGQFDSGLVELEKSGLLDDPEYIKGSGVKKLIGGNENVFAFSLSLASLEMQQFLSLIISPSGIVLGPKIYHFITGELENNDIIKCHDNCTYNSYLAKGDFSGLIVTGKHLIAEDFRSKKVFGFNRFFHKVKNETIKTAIKLWTTFEVTGRKDARA